MSNETTTTEELNLGKILRSHAGKSENGTITIEGEGLVDELYHGVADSETVGNIQKRNAEIMAELGNVTSELFLKEMKKDKDMKQGTVTLPILKDTATATIQRERQVPNAEGGTTTAYGSMRMGWQSAAAANRGGVKKAKKSASEAFREAFGK